MVASGITRRFLNAGNEVIVTLNDPEVPARAVANRTTRSAAAVDLWRPHIDGAVIVVGNAPTTLFRCLEIIEHEGVRPALSSGVRSVLWVPLKARQRLPRQGMCRFLRSMARVADRRWRLPWSTPLLFLAVGPGPDGPSARHRCWRRWRYSPFGAVAEPGLPPWIWSSPPRAFRRPSLTGPEVIDWPSPFSNIFSFLRSNSQKSVALVTTGDPMWHGAGASLVRELGPQGCEIIPAVSGLQLAAARLGWPMAGCEIVTVHGRPHAGLVTQALSACADPCHRAGRVDAGAACRNSLPMRLWGGIASCAFASWRRGRAAD